MKQLDKARQEKARKKQLARENKKHKNRIAHEISSQDENIFDLIPDMAKLSGLLELFDLKHGNIYRLKCPVQHYDWGQKGTLKQFPYIAKLLNKPHDNKPWAELWIGAHPAASSFVLEKEMPLADFIAKEPEYCLGKDGYGDGELPFLLKILCCSKPLSIQSHPDKQTAIHLHSEFPEQFPDCNHKPEMLMALTPFKVMAGFRKVEEALQDISSIPSLKPWLEAFDANNPMKSLCSFILNADEKVLLKMGKTARTKEWRDNIRLFLRLVAEYPGDCGAFFALLLNCITLKPLQYISIGSNMPHAYIEGEGVECMANSNNVIRAGLTQKYVAKDILLDTLNYDYIELDKIIGDNDFSQGNLTVPFQDGFSFAYYEFTDSCDIIDIKNTPAVGIVLYGTFNLHEEKTGSKYITKGEAFFIPAAVNSVQLTCITYPAKVAMAWRNDS